MPDTPTPVSSYYMSDIPTPASSYYMASTHTPAPSYYMSDTPTPASSYYMANTPTPASSYYMSDTPTPVPSYYMSDTPTPASSYYMSDTPTPVLLYNTCSIPALLSPFHTFKKNIQVCGSTDGKRWGNWIRGFGFRSSWVKGEMEIVLHFYQQRYHTAILRKSLYCCWRNNGKNIWQKLILYFKE